MRHYREVHRPARTTKVLDHIVCDVCGRKSAGDDWTKDHYDATRITVKLTTGVSYPEGGFGEEWDIDICPECFVGKLVPWVEAVGFCTVTPKEWSTY